MDKRQEFFDDHKFDLFSVCVRCLPQEEFNANQVESFIANNLALGHRNAYTAQKTLNSLFEHFKKGKQAITKEFSIMGFKNAIDKQDCHIAILWLHDVCKHTATTNKEREEIGGIISSKIVSLMQINNSDLALTWFTKLIEMCDSRSYHEELIAIRENLASKLCNVFNYKDKASLYRYIAGLRANWKM